VTTVNWVVFYSVASRRSAQASSLGIDQTQVDVAANLPIANESLALAS